MPKCLETRRATRCPLQKIHRQSRVAAGLFLTFLCCAIPAAAQPAGDFKTCKAELRDATADALCGSVVVPETRAASGSRSITLPVVRIPALSPDVQEPIFWLQGGPGQSNLDFKPPRILLQHHDFVMVGYRGIDGSSRLDCPEVAEAFNHTGKDLLGEPMRDVLAAGARACAERLSREGVDLSGYTLFEVVHDLEQARTMLGYDRIDLLSESYGTRVAQAYAGMFPDRIRRSVMVGVNPPGHFVWEPDVIDAQLADYAALCKADAACRAKTPDLTSTITEVLANPPDSWLGFAIDPGRVKATSFFLLFGRETAPYVFDAFIAARNGDASGLALMSASFDLFFPRLFVWGEFLAKGGVDFDPARNYRRDLLTSKTGLGSPISLLYFDGFVRGWPRHPPIPAGMVKSPEVETLLVGGTLDFSTPAQFAANELLPTLPRGRQVIVEGMGHTNDIWNLQPQATERLLASFLDSGVPDSSLFGPVDLPLLPRIGLPLIAKSLLFAAIALPLAIMAILWYAVRRLRRARTRPAS